ncbi:Z1 domain-containing protein [Ruminococcus flavefaciens]|uniref:Z1 domain-containing protein n=1 Tax=Ruminococcus flavefaciens TaxID=1265 RepID=UPI0003060868|nr:Z1 domain-containing protein [Ruminococcus flavefaciens]
MSKYNAPLYDAPRSWIQKRREQDMDWDIIHMAKKKNNKDLTLFLERQTEDNDWPVLSIDEWDIIVDECKEAEALQEPIQFRGNDGALYDRSQDNGLKIPEGAFSCWQLYKNNLKWKEQSIKDLEYATIGILRRLSIDTRESGPIKGLVVGHVQSGKTANMEALMAMCADNGWNMFIVLSGSIENLRLQTLRRMEKDLNQEGNLVWRGIEHPSKRSGYGERAQDFRFDENSKLRYFTVCLKNTSRLKNLIDWIHMDKASHEQMKILIIDDEADQASISNTAVDAKTAEKERKGINKLIVNMVSDQHHKGDNYSKGKAHAINYVMYTATPYANFLNEAGRDSLYPRDFIWTLKTSDEYIGPNQIYGTSDPDYSDGLDIKRRISQEDLDVISAIYDYDTSDIPESMKDAICWFICAVAVMRYWGYDKSISMLIHTSQKQICHDAVAEAVSSWIDKNRSNSILKYCKQLYDREIHEITKQNWLSQFAGGYGVDEKEIRDYPAFNKISKNIEELLNYEMKHIKMNEEGELQYHAGLHLVIDNCSKNGISNGDDYVRLAYPEPGTANYPKPAPAFIIIGGSTLSRGLTIEGLVSTFFLRASCQADTLMQMGRWFGYRRGYELMPRIWMTEDTIEKFRFLSQLEIELRDDLKKYMMEGIRPDQYGPRINLSPKVSWLRLTSRNHMRNAINADMDYSGAKPQTTIFENSVTKQKQNIAYTEEFLKSLPGKPKVSTQKNAIYWENISLDNIYNKLLNKKFSFSNRSRVFNEIETFCEWISEVLKDNTLNNWTVIVAGRDNVDTSKDKYKHGYWSVADHTIGKVNRSKRNIEDDTCIDIGVLRSIKDQLADVDGEIVKDYIKNKNEGKDISMPQHIDAIRTEAKKQDIPLLLIYRIDGHSKAYHKQGDPNGNSGTPDRIDLDFDSDIIGIQICIPGDQRNKSFAKKVTVYIPDKDKEDEVEDNHGN